MPRLVIRMLAVASMALLLPILAAAPAAAQQVLGQLNNYTVVEVPPAQPGDDRMIYLIEQDPGLQIRPRGSWTETAAFIAVATLMLGAGMAVHRRLRLTRLVDQPA